MLTNKHYKIKMKKKKNVRINVKKFKMTYQSNN